MLTQMDVYKLPGIDKNAAGISLPVGARLAFGKAWFAEYSGDHEAAAKLLDEAVAKEAEALAKK